MDAANCAVVLLSVPISYHFLRLYSATGRACRRKWRYIKYTPLPLPLSKKKTFRHIVVSLLIVTFLIVKQWVRVMFTTLTDEDSAVFAV